jgi:hypothetical protein
MQDVVHVSKVRYVIAAKSKGEVICSAQSERQTTNAGPASLQFEQPPTKQ